MKAQQRTLLQSIEQNYNNPQYLPSENSTGLYTSETGSCQELFLEKLINIYVLRKKEYNKIDQNKVQKLMKESSGAFTDLLLGLRFMAYCMENKIEVSYEKFGMLKLLTNWMDVFERIKHEQKVNLSASVLSAIHPENHTISSTQELIVYANYIAVDLQTVLERTAPSLPKGINESTSQIESDSKKTLTYDHLQAEDILLLLNNLIPKSLFNVVIPEPLISGRPMTSTNPMDEKQKDLLYSWKSVQYFAKEKTHYQHLVKLLIFTLLKFELSQSQQKNLMLVGIKYFYLFNRIKHQEPFSLWTKVFEKITDAVRFALSSDLILFFRVLKKLGHAKFIDFLREKYEFIDDLHKKMDSNGVIGYPKDSLNVYQSLPITQHIFVAPGTKVMRYIEVLQPYSLLYFYIGLKSLDINIRFYYLGAFTSPVEKKQLLLTRQKCQLEFKGNIIAIEKGLYMFEFDNSYSWMKGKSLFYDTAVLTPLDLVKGGVEKEKFLPVLFNKFQMNACPQNAMIDINQIISRVQMQGQQNQSFQQEGRNSQVFIENEKKKLFITTHYDSLLKVYNLKSVADGKIYEYESQSAELFGKKAKQIHEALQQSNGSAYEWYLDGKYELKNIEMLSKWCMDPVEFAIEIQKANVEKQSHEASNPDNQLNKDRKENEILKEKQQDENQNNESEPREASEEKQIVSEKQSYPSLAEQEKVTVETAIPEQPMSKEPEVRENEQRLEEIHMDEEPVQKQTKMTVEK